MRIHRPEDVGALVRDRRRTLQLSQTDLARRLKVSQRYISHLERGKGTLQLGLVLRVLRELGLTLDAGLSTDTQSHQARKAGAQKPAISIDRLVDD